MTRRIRLIFCLCALVLGTTATTTAMAAKTICVSWRYAYSDWNNGEDTLLPVSGLTYGQIRAAYARINVWRDDVLIKGYPTYTDANGCVSDLGTAAGVYKIQIYPKFNRSARFVNVYPHSDNTARSVASTSSTPSPSSTATASSSPWIPATSFPAARATSTQGCRAPRSRS